ncbi:hypothetical protein BD289DRAFT_175050 [Coniella lustricola]|uniref:Uncharacterized protein n=1 Tax=Coniella lustricola TaxID=2025994 RepID=A0A2T3ADU5_9PEZI|nr:hypothetical protein BD289DRAFT_175050 [Coniella lustricola]
MIRWERGEKETGGLGQEHKDGRGREKVGNEASGTRGAKERLAVFERPRGGRQGLDLPRQQISDKSARLPPSELATLVFDAGRQTAKANQMKERVVAEHPAEFVMSRVERES